MNISVSDAPWSDLPAQIRDATSFLQEHRVELERLVTYPGVTSAGLDFPIDLRIGRNDVCFQFDKFPAPFVRIAGAIGLWLELSIYPPGEA